jgi:hypothetical protein
VTPVAPKVFRQLLMKVSSVDEQPGVAPFDPQVGQVRPATFWLVTTIQRPYANFSGHAAAAIRTIILLQAPSGFLSVALRWPAALLDPVQNTDPPPASSP